MDNIINSILIIIIIIIIIIIVITTRTRITVAFAAGRRRVSERHAAHRHLSEQGELLSGHYRGLDPWQQHAKLAARTPAEGVSGWKKRFYFICLLCRGTF